MHNYLLTNPAVHTNAQCIHRCRYSTTTRLFLYNPSYYRPLTLQRHELFDTRALPLSVRSKDYPDIQLNDNQWRELGFDECPLQNTAMTWPLPDTKRTYARSSPWHCGPLTQSQKQDFYDNVNPDEVFSQLDPMTIAKEYFRFAKNMLYHTVKINGKADTYLHARALAHLYYHIYVCGCFSDGHPALRIIESNGMPLPPFCHSNDDDVSIASTKSIHYSVNSNYCTESNLLSQ